MICTGERKMVGDGLKDIGTDRTRETAWFVMVSEWWGVVD
jgi:hypothetical protein